MVVLNSLKNTIDSDRPTMFIEVNNQNADQFQEWVRASRYRVKRKFKRHKANENFLVVPVERFQEAEQY